MLFYSTVRAYGAGVTGAVLSGALSDGTLGLRAIKLGCGQMKDEAGDARGVILLVVEIRERG